MDHEITVAYKRNSRLLFLKLFDLQIIFFSTPLFFLSFLYMVPSVEGFNFVTMLLSYFIAIPSMLLILTTIFLIHPTYLLRKNRGRFAKALEHYKIKEPLNSEYLTSKFRDFKNT